MIVNILHKGRIPMINVQGPVFGYNIPDGVYALLAKMYPEIPVEFPRSSMDVEASKRRWEAAHAPAPAKSEFKAFLHEVPGDDPKEVATEAEVQAYEEGLVELSDLKQAVPQTADDALIDMAIEEAADKEPHHPIIEAKTVIGGTYDGRLIDSLVKRECKDILEERGYKSTHEMFGKSDPLAWKYRDTVEDLRRKVRKTQE